MGLILSASSKDARYKSAFFGVVVESARGVRLVKPNLTAGDWMTKHGTMLAYLRGFGVLDSFEMNVGL